MIIAEVMKNMRPDCEDPTAPSSEVQQWRETVVRLAYTFEKDNPRFNKGKFINAVSS